MGQILVHEFISLDGVFEAPRWTMEYGFDPKMGEAIGAIMGPCKAILLGRQTFEEFAPAWSGRTADQDPGAPFMNETPKYVVSWNAPERRLEQLDDVGPYSAETIARSRTRSTVASMSAAAGPWCGRCSPTASLMN